MGIEPTSSAWKAEVLPLNYTRNPLLLLPILSNSSITPLIMRKINNQKMVITKLPVYVFFTLLVFS